MSGCGSILRILMYHTVEYEGFVPPKIGGYVTKFAPHKALKLIPRGTLTLDERVVLHYVVRERES